MMTTRISIFLRSGSHEAGPHSKESLIRTEVDKNGVIVVAVGAVVAVVVEIGVEILAVSRVGPRACSCDSQAEGLPVLLLLLSLMLMLMLLLLQGKSSWVKLLLQMW